MAKPLGQLNSENDIVFSKEEEKQLLAMLKKRFNSGQKQIEFKAKKWSLIRNYVHGYHYADGENKRSSIVDRMNYNDGNVDDEYYQNNVMMRIHMSNMTRMDRFNPVVDVEPRDNSYKHKRGARLGQMAIYDLLDKIRYHSKIKKKTNRTICMYGSAWWKTTLDPKAGEHNANPMVDEFGVQSAEDLGCEGRVRIDVIAPKNIITPQSVADPDELDWLIEFKVRTTDYVLRQYGVTVKSESVKLDSEWWGTEHKNRMEKEEEDDLCTLKEMWIAESEDFPAGAIITWVGEKILRSTTLYDFYPEIPYKVAQFIYDDEDINGETPYYFMLPSQAALNQVESNIKRHETMMCKPKWQQHVETVLTDPDGITNETAQVLKWSGTQPPGIINAPELPQTVFTWRDMLIGEMMSTGAAHDIVRPSQPRSGTAIAYEQEQDDTVMAPTIEAIRAMEEESFSLALKLISQYYTDPRNFSMRDGNSVMYSANFSGTDLEGNFNVRVTLQSGLPANKIARQQLIVQLVNNQIITPETAREFFEFGKLDPMLRRATVSLERAERLIMQLEDPLLIQVAGVQEMAPQMFENFIVMAQQLTLAMEEKWESYDPETQQKFMDRYNWYKNQIIQEQMAKMAPQGMPAAGPGRAQAEGAAAPIAPPTMSDSMQPPESQPPRETVLEGGDLFNIPGMEEQQ